MPQVWPLVVKQGATLVLSVDWQDGAGDPIPLDGYTAALQVRRSYPEPALVSVAEVDGPDGVITLGGAAGTVTVTVLPAATGRLGEVGYLYDLFVYAPDGVATCLLEGPVRVSRQVTRTLESP